MQSTAPLLRPVAPPPAPHGGLPTDAGFRFRSLVPTEPRPLAKGRRATLCVSLLLHSLLLAAIAVLPLLVDESMPAVGGAVHAFFVTPANGAAPPPPPPPPARARITPRVPAAPRPAEKTSLVAPIEVPTPIEPAETLDLDGVAGGEGGVPGGVEGGVPGGVSGGVVGGPREAPPPAERVLRVGGSVVAPRLVKKVEPVYPVLALQTRLSAIVIIDAHVDVDGHVKSAKVLRGNPLFDEAAVAAVEQWRYKPLLLNGQPFEFLVTITLSFQLSDGRPPVKDAR